MELLETRLNLPQMVMQGAVPRLAPAVQRIGFLKGKVKVPDDFDRLGGEEIGRLFEGQP